MMYSEDRKRKRGSSGSNKETLGSAKKTPPGGGRKDSPPELPTRTVPKRSAQPTNPMMDGDDEQEGDSDILEKKSNLCSGDKENGGGSKANRKRPRVNKKR